MNHSGSAVVLVLVAVFAACSGHSSGPDGPGTPGALTGDEACQEEATDVCERLSTCAPYALKQTYADLASCVAREKATCLPGLGAAGTSRSPQRTQACGDAVGAMSCDTYLYAYTNHVPDGCTIKPGALPDGAACGSSAQCAGARCVIAAGTACGTCATRAPEGAICTTNSACQIGLVCVLQDASTNTRTCVKPVEEGGACDTTHPCRGRSAGELICDYATGAGICTKPLPGGASCDPADDLCDSFWLGVQCDVLTRTCRPMSLVAAGQPCGAIGITSVGCLAFGTCDITDTTNNTGTCRAALPDGSPCDAASTIDFCLWPAGCFDGVCKIGDPSVCK